MWSKINTRRLAPQMAIAWNLGFGEPFQKKYKTQITKTLQYFNGKSTDYFVDDEEYKKFNQRLEDLIEDKKFLKQGYNDAKKFLESIVKWTEKGFKGNISELSEKKLAKLYKKFAEDLEPKFYVRMGMVYRISRPLEIAVEKKILEKMKNEEKTAELFRKFILPLKWNNVVDERLEALKIAVQKQKVSPEKFNGLVKKHAEKFAYLPMYGFDHVPFAHEHFFKEISEILNPEKELEETLSMLEERKKNFNNAVMELNPGANLKLLLKFFSDMIYLRDYRDMLREKSIFMVRKLYLELAKRANLSVEQVNLLTNQEIIDFLEKGKKIPKEEVLEREKSWLIIQNGRDVKMFSGEKAKTTAEKELGTGGEKESSELKGMVGSKGKAQGYARIVYTNKILPEVKDGEVMVTSMTRQDFVPYLRKCAALVTDEGGITSHAAIICREFGIPCVVGTEHATTAFKTGDFLEVDAEKGIVKKIKKV